MNKLIFVTIIWAFSFSIIGEFLKGVDSFLLALLRVFLAFLCFLPFMKFRGLNLAFALKISAIGAVQIGLMYAFYYQSFKFLKGYEIALFTIFTPIYITLLYDLLNRKFQILYLFSAVLAVFGAFVIKFSTISENFWLGFFLVQGANLCFAFGQVSYKILYQNIANSEQKSYFGYFFVGASLINFIMFLLFANPANFALSNLQIFIIIYLSVVASAVGYFLWNKGASEVDSGILAIMNNALIPLAVIINLPFHTQRLNFWAFFIGLALILLSFLLHQKFIKKGD